VRRRSLVIAVIAVATLAAACDGGGDSAPTTTTSSSTSTTGPVPTTATTAGIPTCATNNLAATISAPEAGAGQRNAVLTFTNNGPGPCTQIGYVGLQLLSQNGQSIPTDVVRDPSQPTSLITLAPGGQSYTTLQWGVIPSGNEPADNPCEADPAQIEITSPNETTSLVQPWPNGPVCGQGEFTTVPVALGAGPS
jgi:hypothetical protein